MRRIFIILLIILIALILGLLILFLLPPPKTGLSALYVSSPIATATPAAASQSGGGFDPAIVAALIGLGGVVVGALIAGGFAVYQSRRSAQLERRLQEQQHQHEHDMLYLQKAVDEQFKTKEREEERKENEAEAAKIAMLRARTTEERVAAYRRALHADPLIAQLQILDMNRPLEVANIYIRVRLHQETRPGYELDTMLREAEGHHDPNELMKIGRTGLESRSSAAIDPDEAVRKYRRCIIVGDPGAGKTTLLKFLALKSVDSQLDDLPDLPIHIELNAFANSEHGDPLEFSAQEWEKRYTFPKYEALEYMRGRLVDGKALLLLDGLDETVTGKTREEAEESYRRVARAIGELSVRYADAPIVVTSRKAGYHQRVRLTGFTELEVLDFRPDDIKQFVQKWFDNLPDPRQQARAEDLNQRLQRNERIQALAANPLLLSLIVIVYEAQLDLPDRRAELYKQCVDTLLTKWDTSRDIRRRREFKPDQKRQLLEEVAWHFHCQGQRYFQESELLKVIADFLPAIGLLSEQNSLVLDEIAAENGLLKEQARGWHGFLHLTLQEYFAALYAIDQNQLEALLLHRGDPWWEEVLLLFAGSVPDASALIQRLLSTGYHKFVPPLTRGARAARLRVGGETNAWSPAHSSNCLDG